MQTPADDSAKKADTDRDKLVKNLCGIWGWPREKVERWLDEQSKARSAS